MQDPQISTAATSGKQRVLVVVARAAVFYPLVWLASAMLVWVVARLTLGRHPRPLFDDPNAAGGIVGALYVPSGTMLGLSPFAFMTGIVALVLLNVVRKPRHPKANVWAAQFAWAWFTTVLLVLLDPGRIFTWYID